MRNAAVDDSTDRHSDLHGRHDMVRPVRKLFDHSGSTESGMVYGSKIARSDEDWFKRGRQRR